MESAASTERPDYAEVKGTRSALPRAFLARLGITRASA
jgi:hypothetical protein